MSATDPARSFKPSWTVLYGGRFRKCADASPPPDPLFKRYRHTLGPLADEAAADRFLPGERNFLRLAFLVGTIPAVTRNVGSSEVGGASGKIRLDRTDLHAVSGEMGRSEDVIIAGIAPSVDRLPAAVDVRNCAKRNLRTSDSGCGRAWDLRRGLEEDVRHTFIDHRTEIRNQREEACGAPPLC
jgi:hypothetical protein